MALIYSPSVNTNSLVLYLNAADSNSLGTPNSNWSDLMGNGDAVRVNSPIYDSTTKSYTFDGTGDYFTLNGNTAFSNITGDITLTAWCNQPSSPGPHQTVICTDLTYRGGLKLMSYYHGGIGAWLANSDGSQDYMLASDGIQGTGWHFLSTTRSTGGQLTLYLDGVLVNSVNTFLGQTYNSGNSRIGLDYHSSGYYYNGNIAMVQGYNRVLQSSEILSLYNQHKKIFGL
jgi:hypothetical protein